MRELGTRLDMERKTRYILLEILFDAVRIQAGQHLDMHVLEPGDPRKANDDIIQKPGSRFQIPAVLGAFRKEADLRLGEHLLMRPFSPPCFQQRFGSGSALGFRQMKHEGFNGFRMAAFFFQPIRQPE